MEILNCSVTFEGQLGMFTLVCLRVHRHPSLDKNTHHADATKIYRLKKKKKKDTT
jgi:hypothetical protein